MDATMNQVANVFANGQPMTLIQTKRCPRPTGSAQPIMRPALYGWERTLRKA